MCRKIICLLILTVLPVATATADNSIAYGRNRMPPASLDPMNRPMDELGVTGKDDTLCSDRWYSCTSYDRREFDWKYPGQPLRELLRYGEPDWPDRDRDGPGDCHDGWFDGD